MTARVNQAIKLIQRPVGAPKPADWSLATEEPPEIAEDEALVRVLYLSLDPAMRGWMNDVRSYVAPIALGATMRAFGIGEVIESTSATLKAGDLVSGRLGVQTLAVMRGKDLFKVDPELAPLPVQLNTFGIPGLTAYFGLRDVAQLRAGETVLVSAAAGAVGQTAGQIAKIKQCRAVGIAGGAEKCRRLIDEFGFDAAIDYKSEDVRARLRETCARGVDVYFDNVGGEILNAALTRLATGARIVICGAISQYNCVEKPPGPSNYLSLIVFRARMQGFVVSDYADHYPEAIAELALWRRQGKLKSREDIVEGIEQFPQALEKLFSGANSGKLVLKVA